MVDYKAKQNKAQAQKHYSMTEKQKYDIKELECLRLVSHNMQGWPDVHFNSLSYTINISFISYLSFHISFPR